MDIISACQTELSHHSISEQQKSVLLDMAKAAGLKIEDFLWCAAQAFQSKDEREAMAELMLQLERTAERTSSAVDETVAFVEASDKRMAELEKSIRQGR
jgi:hypothetical protein